MTLLDDYGPVLARFVDDTAVFNELTTLLSDLHEYVLYSEAHHDIEALTKLAGILYELNEYLLLLLTPATAVLPATFAPLMVLLPFVVESVRPDPEPDPVFFSGCPTAPILPDPDPDPHL